MEPIPRSEKMLLMQAAEGDQASFSALFHAYKHKLYGFLVRITDAPGMAEDIIQDVFLRLWNKRVELTDIDNFGAYLFRMAQNQALNALKRRAREYQYIASLQEPVAPAEAETALNMREVQAKLENAVAQLPPKQKQVFTLSRDKGLKHDEIAREMNISPATVNNHMIEALRTLRKHVGPYLYTSGSYALLTFLSPLF
ncbi:RNA polymerase sigma-70 factor [Chitinophaga horti]|uniref:RNA polymerase sigma-70 factor n=1 Tax=Chitinophaga horti TaxID=2920382 RepID=A0ABY6IZ26_9BACT|nr:RNA polymerase sigma-70 factor [Chitinophaga horti]UYQ91391.1 RNA polymerase sigma-70 factor [Chitinophaga horti]